jgi:nitrate reductase NapD
MNISGVLVCAQPDELDRVQQRLPSVPGVDVHFTDEPGRVIVTIEGADTAEDIERLKQVKALDGVLSADMIHYHFEDDDSTTPLNLLEQEDAVPPELRGDSELDDPDGKPVGSFYRQLRGLSNY